MVSGVGPGDESVDTFCKPCCDHHLLQELMDQVYLNACACVCVCVCVCARMCVFVCECAYLCTQIMHFCDCHMYAVHECAHCVSE